MDHAPSTRPAPALSSVKRRQWDSRASPCRSLQVCSVWLVHGVCFGLVIFVIAAAFRSQALSLNIVYVTCLALHDSSLYNP